MYQKDTSVHRRGSSFWKCNSRFRLSVTMHFVGCTSLFILTANKTLLTRKRPEATATNQQLKVRVNLGWLTFAKFGTLNPK